MDKLACTAKDIAKLTSEEWLLRGQELEVWVHIATIVLDALKLEKTRPNVQIHKISNAWQGKQEINPDESIQNWRSRRAAVLEFIY
jgi:hypothetical protein